MNAKLKQVKVSLPNMLARFAMIGAVFQRIKAFQTLHRGV